MKSQTVFKLVGVYLGALALIALVLLILSPHSEDTVQHEYGQSVTVTAPGGGEALVVAGPLITRLAPTGGEMTCSVVSLVNTGDVPWSMDTREWSLDGPDGDREIFSFSTLEAPGLASGDVAAGKTADGDVCFTAPSDPDEYTLTYQPDSGRGQAYSWVSSVN